MYDKNEFLKLLIKRHGRVGFKYYKIEKYALLRFFLLYDFCKRIEFEKIESCKTYIVRWWF